VNHRENQGVDGSRVRCHIAGEEIQTASSRETHDRSHILPGAFNIRQSAGPASFAKISLKWTMIEEDGLSILEKFQLLRDLGFDGVELDAPNDLPSTRC
jgi:hypothetical protein